MSQLEVTDDTQSANVGVVPEPTKQYRLMQLVMNWSPAKFICVILALYILLVISVLYFNLDPSTIVH